MYSNCGWDVQRVDFKPKGWSSNPLGRKSFFLHFLNFIWCRGEDLATLPFSEREVRGRSPPTKKRNIRPIAVFAESTDRTGTWQTSPTAPRWATKGGRINMRFWGNWGRRGWGHNLGSRERKNINSLRRICWTPTCTWMHKSSCSLAKHKTSHVL